MSDMKTVDITTDTQIKDDVEENDQFVVISEGGVKRARADSFVKSMEGLRKEIADSESRVFESIDEISEKEMPMLIVKTVKKPEEPSEPEEPSDNQLVQLFDYTTATISSGAYRNIRVPFVGYGIYAPNPFGPINMTQVQLYDADANRIPFIKSDGSSGILSTRTRSVLNITEGKITAIKPETNGIDYTYTGTISEKPSYMIITILSPVQSDNPKAGVTYGGYSENYVPFDSEVTPSEPSEPSKPVEYAYEYNEKLADFVEKKIKPVKTINGITPNDDGNVEINIRDADTGIDYKSLNISEPTYNLIDYTKILDAVNGYYNLESGYFIELKDGEPYVSSNNSKTKFTFYDENKASISSETITTKYSRCTIPEGAKFLRVKFNINETKADERKDIIIFHPKFNHQEPEFVPHMVINGMYIGSEIYDYTVPNVNSEIMKMSTYFASRNAREMQSVFRVATFNAFLTRQFAHWYKIKEMLQDKSIDIVGLQEIRYGATSVERRIADYMYGWQFPYGNRNDISTAFGSHQAVLSQWEIVESKELRAEKGSAIVRSIIRLPRYKGRLDRDIFLSIYSYHAVSSALSGMTLKDSHIYEIDYMLSVMEEDTSDVKIICGDTNSFASTMVDGKHSEWEYWREHGYRPVHEGVYNTSYDRQSLDNIFIPDTVECIGYDIVNTTEYPLPEFGGDYLSDHFMVYADLKFDFDRIIKNK